MLSYCKSLFEYLAHIQAKNVQKNAFFPKTPGVNGLIALSNDSDFYNII